MIPSPSTATCSLVSLALLASLGCGKGEHRPELARQLPPPAEPNAPPATAPNAPPPVTAPAADAAVTPPEPGALDRGTRPAPRPIAALALPTPERFTLENGLEVLLVRTEALPIVTLSLELDVGAVTDPDDALGLASVCLDLFSEGSERLDKVAWAGALADHAIELYSPAGAESSTIVLEALTSQLPAGLDLLSELLRTPGMREADFARIVADRKASLAQARGNPAAIAGRIFPALVWGAAHPYGRIMHERHLEALSLERCKGWVAGIRPAGARLWVAGKITRAELAPLLEDKLGAWTGEAPRAPALAPSAGELGTIYAVQVDGAVQSMVVLGHTGHARTADDYEATFMMAQIFGGGFSSRVNMNLREDKGYAYGSRGGFSYRKAGGQLSVSASVEATTTALALREIIKEIKLMRESPPRPEELARERDGALLALPARFSTATSTLSELRALAFHGLPFDWFERHQTALRAVDPDKVHAAATAHLAPAGVVVLVVGDLTKPAKDGGGATIAEELQKLADEKLFGEGGLVMLDVDAERI